MPDSPDYQKYLPNSVRFSFHAMGELAARLGSIVTYDRRGELIWYDDFRYGLGCWTISLAGTGADVSLSTDGLSVAPYCVKLTAGSSGTRLARMNRELGVIELDRAGAEFSFTQIAPSTIVEFEIVVCLKPFLHYISVNLDVTDNKIYVRNAANVFEQVAVLSDVYKNGNIVNSLKVVWDISDNTYIRLLINRFAIDVSTIGLYTIAAGITNSINVQMSLRGEGGPNENMRIYHSILTSNEP